MTDSKRVVAFKSQAQANAEHNKALLDKFVSCENPVLAIAIDKEEMVNYFWFRGMTAQEVVGHLELAKKFILDDVYVE
jgi:hypothetical protein